MYRFLPVVVFGLVAAIAGAATAMHSTQWLWLAAPAGLLLALGVYDLVQVRHTILRNYPVLGHLRFLMEDLRPELQQYFIERNFDGRPYDRARRTIIYERAKGIHAEQAFGTERDIDSVGYEHLAQSVAPVPVADEPPRVLVGGPDCKHPYPMALLNVSAMSFGALSANAVRALNKGAAMGGFAHDTGEGGLTPYHLEHGGDLIWEIGSGYFGARTPGGAFDPAMFAYKAAHPAVKCVSLKLSQGAKPGLGGVLPAAKVTEEIAHYRGVPAGEKCVSPAAHSEFHTPRELIAFIARMRELADGKPTGFKLCVGTRTDILAIGKAMLNEGVTPDFIIVDGAEGGTGAAPLEYEDHVGMPLTDGLMTVHNVLVGMGLRDRIKLGASGKVAGATDVVKRLIQGADYTNSARAMMMALGCIQAQRCHTNTCPTGITTQDPKRARALNVADKSVRVQRYQEGTVQTAMQMIASLGAHGPHELSPHMLRKRVSPSIVRSYAEIYEWLQPGQLLLDRPSSWQLDWDAASADSFRPVPV